MMNQNKFEELLISTIQELRDEFKELRQDVSTIKTDVAWMKGKLEGRADVKHIVLTGISIFVAICAVVVAWLK